MRVLPPPGGFISATQTCPSVTAHLPPAPLPEGEVGAGHVDFGTEALGQVSSAL